MGTITSFFKDTIIYGLATVLPRLMNFILVPLFTATLKTDSYSDNTTFYVYAAFFNVLLTYGMETAFFRFFSKQQNKNTVVSTALISLSISTVIFAVIVYLFNAPLATFVNLKLSYFNLLIAVLTLDTLVVIPFAYLRAAGRPFTFAWIKLSNISIYVALNFFFLWAVPKFNIQILNYNTSNLVYYIFIANVIASATTLLLLAPYFFKIKYQFSWIIFKRLLNYGWPIMIAGFAYVINENFDKWLLPYVLGKDINGAYSGCYKIGVFMTIFIQAFRLGAEPFFFNHAKEKNAQKTYAFIMKYFVIFGAFVFVFVMAYLDVFKSLLVRDESYWGALKIVPVILLANLCLGIYFNLAIWYKLTDKTQYGMYLSLLGAGVTICFNIFMIRYMGFMAAAWATLLAYGIMMVASYFLGKKHYPIPYNIKSILGYLGLSCLLVGFTYFTHNNYYINTVIVLVFLLVVFGFEKQELKKQLS